ncbi:MAG: hypothetical protein D6769_00380 [Methanobacteriota archaeon]|nr:MAG: hypothetical protein D6769_00380 [Euryarchaeota archaeon]
MRKFLLVLLLASLYFAATVDNITNFLLPGEENATIEYKNFTNHDGSYSLVLIDGKLAFLLRGNEIIDSKSEIRDILWENYSNTNIPSDLNSTIEKLKEAALSFNASRSDGLDNEEFGCRKTLGENLPKPKSLKLYDNNLYVYYASYACESAYYADMLQCVNRYDIVPDIQEFFTSSYTIDEKLSTIMDNLATTDVRLVSPKMSEIADSVQVIRNEVSDIKKSRFRRPRDDVTGEVKTSECVDCFGICDELIVNKTALDTLENDASMLAQETKPLYSFESDVDNIFTSTRDRIQERANLDKRWEYENNLSSILSGWDALKNRTDAVLKRVDDKKLKERRDLVIKLQGEIDDALTSNNFTLADQKMKAIGSMVSYVSNATNYYEGVLSTLDISRKKSEALFLSVFPKMGDELQKEALLEKKKDLDSKVSGKMSPDALVLYAQDYQNLTAKLIAVNAQQRNGVFEMMGRAFMKYYNSFYSLVNPLLPDTLESKTSFMKLSPLVFSPIVGLAYASLVLWFTVPKFYAHKERKIRSRGKRMFFFSMVLFFAFLVFILITALSFFTYDRAVNNAGIIEFSEAIKRAPSLGIVLISPTSNMKACASTIKERVDGDKNITIYEKKDNSCLVNGESKPAIECSAITFPAIVLQEASETTVSGSVVGDAILTLGTTDDAYKDCFVADSLV